MITFIDQKLGQQIVNTIKEVCRHDINIINKSGIIIASTDESRIGTFHEIGQKAAATGTALEVSADDSFTGTKQGVNLPLFHEGRLLAVVGITGQPDEVRQFAFLAQRITNLLIREQELNLASRRTADKKHFVMQSLIQPGAEDQPYLTDYLRDFDISLTGKKRLILIRIDPHENLQGLTQVEPKVQQLFAQLGLTLYTFLYPSDFLAVMDEPAFATHGFVLKSFAAKQTAAAVAVGKAVPLFSLPESYQSALSALRTLAYSGGNYVLFDDLSLEIILSGVNKQNRENFLQKTIAPLSDAERELIKVYFEEEMSLTNTCQRLFLHKNTLQYKLNHIHEKCSLNPRKFQDAVMLYLALRLDTGE